MPGSVVSGATISGGTLELTSGEVETGIVIFAPSVGGLLKLDDSQDFGGTISEFGLPDMLDLTDTAASSGARMVMTTTPLTSGLSWGARTAIPPPLSFASTNGNR
jgi:hypothetical protein